MQNILQKRTTGIRRKLAVNRILFKREICVVMPCRGFRKWQIEFSTDFWGMFAPLYNLHNFFSELSAKTKTMQAACSKTNCYSWCILSSIAYLQQQ